LIYIVTLHPAIDRAVFVSAMDPSEVNRVLRVTKQAAGKGVNVATALYHMDTPCMIATILGGENGSYIASRLNEKQIPTMVQWIGGETRENIKIIPSDGTVLEFNQNGPSVSEEDVNKLMDQLMARVVPGDLVVLTGSIPIGISLDTYKRILFLFHQIGVITVLDASKEAFAYGLEAQPHIIKPNRSELEDYCGHKLSTLDDVIEEAKAIVRKGVRQVIVTLGDQGSLYVDKDQVLHAKPYPVIVKNTVGAGDTFVAGFIADYQTKDIVTRFRWANALATCSVTSEASGLIQLTEANAIFDNITIESIETDRRGE